MRDVKIVVSCLFVLLLVVLQQCCVNGEDPYRFYSWRIHYGFVYPLGVKQQVLFLLSCLVLLGHATPLNFTLV